MTKLCACAGIVIILLLVASLVEFIRYKNAKN